MSGIQIGIICIASLGSGLARHLMESVVKMRVINRNASADAILELQGTAATGAAHNDFWR